MFQIGIMFDVLIFLFIIGSGIHSGWLKSVTFWIVTLFWIFSGVGIFIYSATAGMDYINPDTQNAINIVGSLYIFSIPIIYVIALIVEKYKSNI